MKVGDLVKWVLPDVLVNRTGVIIAREPRVRSTSANYWRVFVNGQQQLIDERNLKVIHESR